MIWFLICVMLKPADDLHWQVQSGLTPNCRQILQTARESWPRLETSQRNLPSADRRIVGCSIGSFKSPSGKVETLAGETNGRLIENQDFNSRIKLARSNRRFYNDGGNDMAPSGTLVGIQEVIFPSSATSQVTHQFQVAGNQVLICVRSAQWTCEQRPDFACGP